MCELDKIKHTFFFFDKLNTYLTYVQLVSLLRKRLQSNVMISTFIPQQIKDNLGIRKQCEATLWSSR